MVLSMSRPWKHPVTGVYYFRKIVPADVRALVGKWEWKVSLETKDPDEARRKHAVEAVRVSQELAALRRRLATLSAPPLAEIDAETIKRVGEAYYVHLLEMMRPYAWIARMSPLDPLLTLTPALAMSPAPQTDVQGLADTRRLLHLHYSMPEPFRLRNCRAPKALRFHGGFR